MPEAEAGCTIGWGRGCGRKCMRDAHLGVCAQDVRPAICKDLIRVRSRARVRAGASIRVTIGAAIREDR